MRLPRRRLATLAAAVLLAAPPSALGQSAGDDQYQDPFAGDGQGQSQGGGADDEPAAPAPAPASEPQPSSSAPESTPAAPAAQLPYTGADAGAILVAGAVLLAGGIALRVRVRDS